MIEWIRFIPIINYSLSIIHSSMRPHILFPILIVVLVALVVISDVQRRQAQVQVRDLTQLMQQGGEESREQARTIVEKVRTHMVIDDGSEPTVAAIVDVAVLREKNAFYNKAENGDFLVVTPTRAILYRASEDRILDVVPVELNDAPAPADTGLSTATGS